MMKPEQGVDMKEIIESMDDYADEIEASLKRIRRGDVMDCTVVAFDETGVSVDLSYYAPGRIPAEEMSADPCFSVMSDVNVGDTFRAIVQQTDDGAGNIILSKKEADGEFAWERLEEMKAESVMVSGKIAEVTRAGAIMYVEGIRGFIPASKLDVKFVEDTAPYLEKHAEVLITEVDSENHRLILSAKELLTEKMLKKRSEKTGRLVVGSIVSGTVESLKEYGAFVDIGDDMSGLLHISEISERRIKHPANVLSVGQEIRVMITKIENGRISLSMKEVSKQDAEAEEAEAAASASEYKSEYIPNNPFAELIRNLNK